MSLANYRRSGQIAAQALKIASQNIRVGASGLDIEKIVNSHIVANKALPAFKGYGGYKFATCISINEIIVHGIPTNQKFKHGDVVKVDVGVKYQDKITDTAITVAVGDKIPETIKELIKMTKEALVAGIKQAKSGNYIGDISHVIEKVADKYHYGVPYDLSGHGIGPTLHEPPSIFNYGQPKTGQKITDGMILAIEPMFSFKADKKQSNKAEITTLKDSWAIAIKNGSIGAHFEHTILVTNNHPEILTNFVDTQG